jgi:hypothetical protein
MEGAFRRRPFISLGTLMVLVLTKYVVRIAAIILFVAGFPFLSCPSGSGGQPRGKTPLEIVRSLHVPYDEHDVDNFPDFTYYMRAKLTAEQWRVVEKEVSGRWMKEKQIIGWDWIEPEPRPAWWTPRNWDDITYSQKVDRFGHQVKYEDGFLYYLSFKS